MGLFSPPDSHVRQNVHIKPEPIKRKTLNRTKAITSGCHPAQLGAGVGIQNVEQETEQQPSPPR